MKSWKKRIAALLMVVMTAGLCTGCGLGNTAFKYGDTKVSMAEASLYAKLRQYQTEKNYGSYFGEDMWSMEIEDGKTLEQSVKEETVEQIKRVKVLNAHAEEMKVSLTAEEEKAAKENAKAVLNDETGKKLLEIKGVDEELLNTVYVENALASKVYDEIIGKVDTTVTDEQAKVTTVYKLVFATKKTDTNGKEVELSDAQKKKQKVRAKKAYRALRLGADMTALAQQYDIRSIANESYAAGKSLGGEAFEKAVSKLKVGEDTGIIEDNEGYVIARLLDDMDEEKTEENKAVVLQERQAAAFDKQFAEWTKDTEADWSYDKVSKKFREELTFTYGE